MECWIADLVNALAYDLYDQWLDDYICGVSYTILPVTQQKRLIYDWETLTCVVLLGGQLTAYKYSQQYGVLLECSQTLGWFKLLFNP